LKTQNRKGSVHVVVTGRPTNLSSESFGPKEVKASGLSIIKLLPRSSDDSDNEEDGKRVLTDTIIRLDRFLRAAGEGGNYRLYDGLIGRMAPVSHRLHALDWLIDRASILRGQTVTNPRQGEVLEAVTKKGWVRGVVANVSKAEEGKDGWIHLYDRESGETLKKVPLAYLRRPKRSSEVVEPSEKNLLDDLLTLEEYRIFQMWHNTMGPDARRAHVRSFLRTKCATKIESIQDLADTLNGPDTVDCGQCIQFLVGGPLTALDKLMEIGGRKLVGKICDMTMMMGAWSNNKPGSFNLFKNQFNIGADSAAAQSVLIKRASMYKDAIIRLVPTETCKNALLKFNPDSLRKQWGVDEKDMSVEARAILGMYTLWWAIGGKRDMFCFDVNTNVAAVATGRALLEWKPAKAEVDPDGTTVYIRETDASTAKLFCATPEVKAPYAKAHQDALKNAFFP